MENLTGGGSHTEQTLTSLPDSKSLWIELSSPNCSSIVFLRQLGIANAEVFRLCGRAVIAEAKFFSRTRDTVRGGPDKSRFAFLTHKDRTDQLPHETARLLLAPSSNNYENDNKKRRRSRRLIRSLHSRPVRS